MLTKYPDTPLNEFSIRDRLTNERWYGETGQYASPVPYESEIHLSPSWFGDSSMWIGGENVSIAQAYEHDLAEGFHPTPDDHNAGYNIAAHEFGHSLDRYGGRRASDVVDMALRQRFIDLNPELHGADPYETVEAYKKWLKEELPGYSFAGGRLNGPEAIAEAFAHVEVDPKNATDAERTLHSLLLESVNTPRSQPLSVWSKPAYGAPVPKAGPPYNVASAAVDAAEPKGEKKPRAPRVGAEGSLKSRTISPPRDCRTRAPSSSITTRWWRISLHATRIACAPRISGSSTPG